MAGFVSGAGARVAPECRLRFPLATAQTNSKQACFAPGIDRLVSQLLRNRPRSRLAGIVVATVAITLTTLVILPLREVAPAVSTGVLYLLAVLLVSTLWGTWLGVATAVTSALAWGFFHLPPTGRFTIADPENLVALGVFLATAVVASTVADLVRSAAAETHALRRSDVMKTTLLRAVSHDLRTPLTAILAAGESVRSPSLGPRERDELGAVVVEEAQRLSRLIDKLLDLSRLQAGEAEARRDWCSIEEAVEGALEHVEAAVPVEVALDRDLPLVQADAVQLERVLANLIENAQRFSGGHPVKLSASATGDRLTIRVLDRGPGIPAEMLPHVFEPFRRGAGDGEHRGSGLGLAIVKGFVEANGGRVWAESPSRQGTVFVVELPLSPQPAAHA